MQPYAWLTEWVGRTGVQEITQGATAEPGKDEIKACSEFWNSGNIKGNDQYIQQENPEEEAKIPGFSPQTIYLSSLTTRRNLSKN